jgi:hypothetical protein
MSVKTNRSQLLLPLLLGICLLELACGHATKPAAEAAPSPVPVEAKQQQLAQLPPPQLNEVQQAVKRVFKDYATVDTSRQPSFVAGDFNGDLSQDVAVIIKPAPGKLAEMNEEYPAWILRDPFAATVPGGPRIKVEDNDVLLAVIHGHEKFGWRDSQATQTYLLRNAVGSTISLQAGKAFVSENAGKPLPRIHGDLIKEVIGGKEGYLYYAGPTYSWFDPKTVKDETQSTAVHGRKMR